jgi:hypothetical protein
MCRSPWCWGRSLPKLYSSLSNTIWPAKSPSDLSAAVYRRDRCPFSANHRTRFVDSLRFLHIERRPIWSLPTDTPGVLAEAETPQTPLPTSLGFPVAPASMQISCQWQWYDGCTWSSYTHLHSTPIIQSTEHHTPQAPPLPNWSSSVQGSRMLS